MPVRPPISADSAAVPTSEAMRRWASREDRPRVLLVARWPISGVRAHLLANYSGLVRGRLSLHVCRSRRRIVGAVAGGIRRHRGIGIRRRAGGEPALPAVAGRARSASRRTFRPAPRHGLTAAAHTALANLGIGVPHLVALHKPLRPNQFPGWLGCLKRWMLRHALQQADAIVTASDDARANLLEHVPALLGHADRLLTVADDIPTERWTALLESLAARTLSNLPSKPLAA